MAIAIASADYHNLIHNSRLTIKDSRPGELLINRGEGVAADVGQSQEHAIEKLSGNQFNFSRVGKIVS
jgi:hypothetical protein